MNEPWKLYDTIQEIVYVMDMETYDLVFMNRFALEQFGYVSLDQIKGKKCYEALQHLGAPCPFCTNHLLSPGEFYEWQYTNPVMHKTYFLKDTMIEWQGRKYRMEIAIDSTAPMAMPSEAAGIIQHEFIVNECLKQMHTTAEAEESIRRMLAFLGENLRCNRFYIFEEAGDMLESTYEWHQACQTVRDEPERVQKEALSRWYKIFQQGENVIIPDIGELRTRNWEIWMRLEQEGATNMVASPLRDVDEILGLLVMEGLEENSLRWISSLMSILSPFAVSMLKRRDLVRNLRQIGYQDKLTGAWNRHAMEKDQEQYQKADSLGVIYCDVCSLKTINDTLGHQEGDRTLEVGYRNLIQCFPKCRIYRVGGDEFLVFWPQVGQEEFIAQVESARQAMQNSRCQLAIGCVWDDSTARDLNELISRADQDMYGDKGRFYTKQGQNRPRQAGVSQGMLLRTLEDYLKNCRFDLEFLLDSLAAFEQPYYIFMGDMQKNVFYISNNMRQTFGFESNVVYDFLEQWRKRVYEKDQERFAESMEEMLEYKKSIHDLRYQIRDASGRPIWIHSWGMVQWSPDKREPLFFSGMVTNMEVEPSIDPVTGLMKYQAVLQDLNRLYQQQARRQVIGLGLNRFADINTLVGRVAADNILREIFTKLEHSLGDEFIFYRVEGMRFLGISRQDKPWDCDALAETIQQVILSIYQKRDIHMKSPCAIGFLECPEDGATASELVENALGIIRAAKQQPAYAFARISKDVLSYQKRKAELVLALTRSVENGFQDFYVVIQPIVEQHTQQIAMGEMLLRWNNKGSPVSPAEFIPLLEEENLIVPVGRWAFEQAVKACKQLLSHIPNFKLSFNVSYLQVMDQKFGDFMEETLKNYQLDGSHLIMELTESHFDTMPTNLQELFSRCCSMGMLIALDDFGNGYSSIRRLLQHPADIVKLDRSLTQEIATSSTSLQFIKSIIYACHQVGKCVCVEGVETSEELQNVQEAGGDMIQGFYFYRPQTLDELCSRLEGQK